ncbi:Mannosyl phosphorylinositol ceramide synthase SUR1 [Penicillium waksmanii]|uniref:Mannosyl phosphorylinositol ceramide synthase SUR1 n=1 Tax=Penicillium waksmanii TaxID=69791 RepID=UPI002547F800|nr:Mannosyl phosphorylinositol ceramide synthase SUR1 [Penicillium waksmanii]KAJ6000354.1 Mannosyl phosphorylinositol ceramide synthase SUR1 [Penicillium waksmanii]
MRRGLSISLLACLIVIVLLIRNIWILLSLLVEDAAADAIHHENIPEVWFGAQKSCIDLHPDYEYILWTDEKARNFIAAKYPWFLETFDGYKYPIQRADSIRYFVLAYYGGTYIDLDDGCNRRLDPLLAYPAWLRRTVPTGISNDAMGSAPQHPFFLRVIELLQQYDRDWPLPYITVMYSTGPLFLSVIWEEYIQDPPSETNRIRVLMQDEYKNHLWSFFTHHTGNSWHGKDAQFIFWMGQHWMLLTFCGVLLAFAVGSCLFWAYYRIVLRRNQYRYSYTSVPSGIFLSSISLSPLQRARRGVSTLLPVGRVSFEESKATDVSCELGRNED